MRTVDRGELNNLKVDSGVKAIFHKSFETVVKRAAGRKKQFELPLWASKGFCELHF